MQVASNTSISKIMESYFATDTSVAHHKIHFIGIGGIGVSALARWFLSRGSKVSGSDGSRSSLIEELITEGVSFFDTHASTNISPNTTLVVYSNAVPVDNPERVQAQKLHIPVVSYPEVIGELTRHYKTIAVAGMHGKSTTTAMIASIAISAGLDPTVIVGVKLDILGGKNFRAGKSNYLILEADEYAKAFLHYTPTISVVTNLDAEHLEIYGTLANIKKSFLRYFSQTTDGGTLVLNADNKNLISQKKQIEKIVRDRKLQCLWYSNKTVAQTGVRQWVQVPGAHNIENAHAAYGAARACGISPAKIAMGLKKYKGAWRRMEYRGILKKELSGGVKKIKIFDDYGHHPTEVAATLSAFREKYPHARIICVFQPHQAQRVSLLFKEFIGAFQKADALILLPIYIVPGRDMIDEKQTSEILSKKIKEKEPKKYVAYESNLEFIPRAISTAIQECIDQKKATEIIVVMMGAGPIVNTTPQLLD